MVTRAPCALCGIVGERSAEHVIPQWFSRWLVDHRPDDATVEELLFTVTNRARRTVSMNTINLRTHRICKDCNGGWMKDIEDTTAPILKPMLLGDTTHLSPMDRRRVAIWATKTVITWELADQVAEPSFSEDDLRWFQAQRRPFPNSVIWLATFTPKDFQGRCQYRIDDLAGPRPGDRDRIGHSSTLLLGNLLLKVARKLDGSELQLRLDQTVARGIIQLWPHTGANVATWPPSGVHFDEDTFSWFVAGRRPAR